ncbi:MAG: acyl carrier protein [Gammaproteobacteria bacterium]|nr:MAG: acyl carrier protein [Gammaproteobacteria bacterium]
MEMNKEEIFLKLQNIMADLFEIDPEKITLEANLYEDLDIDSIDAVDLAIEVRDLTGRGINPDDFKKVRTVADLVDAAKDILDS